MSRLEIRHLTSQCGSEILGVDPRNIDDVDVARIKAEISNRCMIVIRGAHLEPHELSAFAKRFGPLLRVGNTPEYKGAEGVQHIYNIYKVADAYPAFKRSDGKVMATNSWHTDATHERCPPAFTMLSAEVIPEGYGDTMWANQYCAYDGLSDAMKKMLEPLRAGYVMNSYFQKFRTSDDMLETFHPLVRVHPENGRKTLFINVRNLMSVIEGMTEEESRPITEFLYAHSQQPEHICRHRWAVGDLVCWDNRCSLHYALLDYSPDTRRDLARIMVKGEEPISVAAYESRMAAGVSQAS